MISKSTAKADRIIDPPRKPGKTGQTGVVASGQLAGDATLRVCGGQSVPLKRSRGDPAARDIADRNRPGDG